MISGTSIGREFRPLNSLKSSHLNSKRFRFLDMKRLTVQQRIQQILDDQDGEANQVKVAKAMGLSKGRISQLKNDGANTLRYTAARGLSAEFGYSMTWLLDGEGHRFDKGTLASPPMVFVDWHKDVRLGAGQGIEAPSDGEVEQIGFRRDWLAAKGWNPDAIRAANAMGRSMEPRIQDGDLLLINLKEREVKNGKVYAIRESSGDRVKRLFMRYDGALRIVSDNPSPEFVEEVVPANKLAHVDIIGRVVWIGGGV